MAGAGDGSLDVNGTESRSSRQGYLAPGGASVGDEIPTSSLQDFQERRDASAENVKNQVILDFQLFPKLKPYIFLG